MATKKKNDKLVINQIVIKAPTRKSSDVGEWRTALQSADQGRVKRLYDLFEDLTIDGVLADAIEKRILAVTNSPLTFQNAEGQEVPEMVTVIDSPAFEELLTTIMHRIIYGRSGGEFDFREGFQFYPFPAKHINMNLHRILFNDAGEEGVSYLDDDHLLILGKPRNFGLLLKAAPLAIWKRGGFGDYAQWLEIFGMPQRIGKYSSYDPESRKLLEQALEQAGSAPWVVIPKESEVETTNNTGSGSSGSAYNEFRKACNEEILITFLGQTLTTVQNDTGARSLGEVHKEVEEGKNRADMRYVQRVLNYQVLPLLEKRGFPVNGGKFVFPEAAEQLTVSDIVQLSDIIEIPASFLHDKYSIPVPQDGEIIARRNSPMSSMMDPGPISQADRSFWKGLFDFFALAPRVGASSTALRTGNLNLSDDTLKDRIIKHSVEEGGFYPELFDFVRFNLLTGLDTPPTRLADLGFTYNYQDDAFRTAQELNLFHFSAGKTLAEIQKLNEIYRKSSSYEDFRKEASQVVDTFNETWQRTEWQTAGLISASTSTYNRLMQKTKLFPNWQYKTVGDDKVRPEHRLLDDIVLPANDPRWDKIYPPNGWKCRCYVVAKMAGEVDDSYIEQSRRIVDEYIASPEFKKIAAQGFGVNRAKVPEVYSENQAYINKFPQQASRLLNNVNYHTYGLKSYEAMRSAADMKLPEYAGSMKDFVDNTSKENNIPLVRDYNNRLVRFDENAKGDAKLLKAATEALSNPDEVWINNYKSKLFDQFVILKYYSDQVMAVVAGIERGVVYRVSSYFIAEEIGRKYDLRHGLLIKRPKNPTK